MSKSGKTWTSTRYQYLYRHSSGVYYARLTVNKKKIWRSLKTDILSIARAQLADILKEEEKRAELGGTSSSDAITLEKAAALRLERVIDDISTKESTKTYQREIHHVLFRDWPDLAKKDVRKVTEEDCRKWAVTHRKRFSPSRFNGALGAMKQIFDLTIELRLRFTNPAKKLKRAKSVQRDLGLVLPQPEIFAKWVAEIRSYGRRYSAYCGDWVEFQSYSGLRPDTETPFVTWRHCDFENGELVVTGNLENEGTKNRQTRRIPMNEKLRGLLERMREERKNESLDTPVLQVKAAKKSMNTAADAIGMIRLKPYDLRHLFATRCLESGVDAPTVASWLGHKDKGALLLKTYNHIRKPHSHEAAKKVSF